MTAFLPILDEAKLAARIREIDKALDVLGRQTVSQITIGSTTYTRSSIKQLRELRDYTERQYHRARAAKGKRTRVIMQG